MAVDYIHRLVLTGKSADVRQFAADMRRTMRHGPVGRVKAWREYVPLCFDAMWERCPSLRRVHDVPPFNPYELAVWPLEHLRDGRDRKRYRFHTRSMDVFPVFRIVSRYYPRLAFVIATLCLDGGEFEGFFFHEGRMRRWTMSDSRQDVYWGRAAKKIGWTGEIRYDNDELQFLAEDGMWEETLRHWDRAVDAVTLRAGGRTRTRPGKRPDTRVSWWNRPQRRPLWPDRSQVLIEAAEYDPALRETLGL